MLKNSLLVALFKLGPNGGQLPQVVVMHVKENQDISYTKGGTESGWPSSGSSWKIFLHIFIYTPLLNCQCCFKFCGCGYLHVHLKEYSS